MNKLKVGVLGCADIARRMVIPAMKQLPELELIAVASRNMPKAQQYAEQFECEAIEGYSNLISRDDIDMIYMPLPTALHFEWAIKALESDKHLLLEKSLASNFFEAQQIVDTARTHSKLIQENFMFQYHTQFKKVQSYVAGGHIGELRSIRSTFGFPPFTDNNNIRYKKELGGGSLLDAGAYTLKIAQLLLGFDLIVGAATMIYDKEKKVDLEGAVFLHDKKGVAVETAYGFDNYYQCSLEVWGSKGRLTANRIFTSPPDYSPQLLLEKEGKTETIFIEAENHFMNLLKDFHQTICSGSFEAKYTEVLDQSRLIQEVMDKAFIVNN